MSHLVRPVIGPAARKGGVSEEQDALVGRRHVVGSSSRTLSACGVVELAHVVEVLMPRIFGVVLAPEPMALVIDVLGGTVVISGSHVVQRQDNSGVHSFLADDGRRRRRVFGRI